MLVIGWGLGSGGPFGRALNGENLGPRRPHRLPHLLVITFHFTGANLGPEEGWGLRTSQRASHAPAWPWRAAMCSGAAPSGPAASAFPGSSLRRWPMVGCIRHT